MALLAIDVGNSLAKLALFEGETLAATARVRSDTPRAAEEWAAAFRDAAGDWLAQHTGVEAAVCASRAGVLADVIEGLRRGLQLDDPLVLDASLEPGAFGLRVRYDRPADIGRDRLANAVALRELHQARGLPAIAVDLGTATTFDVLDACGTFAGGAIAPGLGAGADALLGRAPHLPEVDLTPADSAVATSTVAALRSGIVLGHAEMVDGMVRRVARELAGEPFVVATGGWAATVATVSATIARVEPHLTLQGIRLIWQRVRGVD